jgi:hypothetical protein
MKYTEIFCIILFLFLGLVIAYIIFPPPPPAFLTDPNSDIVLVLTPNDPKSKLKIMSLLLEDPTYSGSFSTFNVTKKFGKTWVDIPYLYELQKEDILSKLRYSIPTNSKLYIAVIMGSQAGRIWMNHVNILRDALNAIRNKNGVNYTLYLTDAPCEKMSPEDIVSEITPTMNTILPHRLRSFSCFGNFIPSLEEYGSEKCRIMRDKLLAVP